MGCCHFEFYWTIFSFLFSFQKFSFRPVLVIDIGHFKEIQIVASCKHETCMFSSLFFIRILTLRTFIPYVDHCICSFQLNASSNKITYRRNLKLIALNLVVLTLQQTLPGVI